MWQQKRHEPKKPRNLLKLLTYKWPWPISLTIAATMGHPPRPEPPPAAELEAFRWFKPTPRSNRQKAHRISHRRDFHDLAGCLERADIWIAEQQGRHIPQTEEISFSPQEVAAILHLLGSVRKLDTESEALRQFEKRIRAVLGKLSTDQINEAVTEHEETELFEHIKEIRKQLIPYQKAPEKEQLTLAQLYPIGYDRDRTARPQTAAFCGRQ